MIFEQIRLIEALIYIKRIKLTWLDLGCGTGSFVSLARKLRIKASGVDKRVSNTRYVIQNDIEIYNPKLKYDVVSFYHVLEHLDDPYKMIERVKRFLKLKGILIIEVPVVGNLTEKWLKQDYFAYNDQTHKNFYTKEKWLNLIKSNGFKIIGKGVTFHEFPFTLVTTNFRQSLLKGILSLFFWFPYKFLSIIGLNDEIIRYYFQKK